MLNESSADLEQFMSRQMRVLSSQAHLIYLSYVQRPVSAHRALLFLSSLSLEPPHWFHLLSVFLLLFFLSINCLAVFVSPPLLPVLSVTPHFHIYTSPPSTFSGGEAVR